MYHSICSSHIWASKKSALKWTRLFFLSVSCGRNTGKARKGRCRRVTVMIKKSNLTPPNQQFPIVPFSFAAWQCLHNLKAFARPTKNYTSTPWFRTSSPDILRPLIYVTVPYVTKLKINSLSDQCRSTAEAEKYLTIRQSQWQSVIRSRYGTFDTIMTQKISWR